jgi:hypothetical protein
MATTEKRLNNIRESAELLHQALSHLVAENNITEARLDNEYELNEKSHAGLVWLYTADQKCKPARVGDIFRGDDTQDVLELTDRYVNKQNRHFMAALQEHLSPNFPYLSQQIQYDFNKQGARDVSERFPVLDLLDALVALRVLPVLAH